MMAKRKIYIVLAMMFMLAAVMSCHPIGNSNISAGAIAHGVLDAVTNYQPESSPSQTNVVNAAGNDSINKYIQQYK